MHTTSATASAVAPGVWSFPIPFPNPLRYSFVYSVEVDRGVILVDLGWDSEQAWGALMTGLARSGHSLDQVRGAVITHLHPDHFGLAKRLRQLTSAWIAVHASEMGHVATDELAREHFLERYRVWMQGCGCPRSELEALEVDAPEVRSRLASVQPDVILEDGAAVPETADALTVIHSPGHTPGHICLTDSSRGLLFTGDHLLPRVTPNVSWRPDQSSDPLHDFVQSLDKMDAFADHLVLPGHEWAFDSPQRRTADLRRHHYLRLEEVEAAVHSGARTTWDVTRAVRWRRSFETLEPRARRSALGETGSHLIRLASLGRIRCRAGVPQVWLPPMDTKAGKKSEP